MPRPIAPPSQYRIWIKKVLWLIVWLIARLMRTDVRGCVPDAPCIIVSNHLNTIDIPLAGRYVVRYGERIHWLAKTELFPVPILGALLRAVQAVRIHRGSADRRAIEEVIAYARTDKVWIFPEGHRSETGRLQEGKEGTVLIARRAGVPLVPVGIAGTESGLLPLLLRRKAFRLRIGEPFTLPPALSRAAATVELMRRIEELLPEPQRRVME